MALLPLNLDYTDKDFASLRARLFNLIGSVFPDWTDREVANFGNILVELFAYVGDVLLFYQDSQAKESRWSDASLRRSVLALAKMLNYTPEGNAAATANVLVTLDQVPTADVLLDAGRVYETADVTERVRFQQLFDAKISAGLDPPQVFVIVENSEDHEETFTATGLPSQELLLAATPYLDGSAVVTAGNGDYTQVDTFLNSTATDRHFTIFVDENDRARVRFGNDRNGETPSGVVTVLYKTGGGAAGNVDANTITRLQGSLTTVLGARVNFTVTNPSKASGGADRETTASIKQKGPPATKVTDRIVSRDDYEIEAVQVQGVARALMITSNEVEGVPENRGLLYIVPDGGGTSTDALKSAVSTAIGVTKPTTITFRYTVEDPAYLAVDVQATVYFRPGISKRATVTAINAALADYFAITNADGTINSLVDFGINYGADMALPLSDVFAEVEGVTGVRKIGDRDVDFLLNLVHADLPLRFFEFPVLGTVKIIDGDTGEEVLPL